MINYKLGTMYRKLLQWLCRRELRKIADKYPMSKKELIEYFDFMAVEYVNRENKHQERVLNICLSTVKALENSQKEK